MKKTRLPLARKITISLAFLLAITFFIGITVGERILERKFLTNAKESISSITELEGRKVEDFFREKEIAGLYSVEYIKDLFNTPISADVYEDFDDKYKVINGALRTNVAAYPIADISGVFLSSKVDLDEDIKKAILATEGRFEDYARGVISVVFNMYFISKDQFIRIYEKDWALEIEPDHDFTRDIFYFIADPENDPEKKPKWTPAYYDSIWKKWMTSLIIPVYIKGEFIGIVGHDIILDEVYKRILRRKYYDSGYSFIFNGDGEVVLHPSYLDRLMEKAEMGEYLSFQDLRGKGLKVAMEKALDSASLVSIRFKEGDEVFYLTAYKLRALNWYIATVIPQAEIVQFLPSLIEKFVFVALAISFVLTGVIGLIIWYYVLRPIRKISRGTEALAGGDLAHRIEHDSWDEIGSLARSFNKMATNLQNELKQRKAMEKEIKKTNKDMETFLYTVSHDLKSPLFSIKGFADLIHEEIAECETEKSKHFFKRIKVNVTKMNNLIEDLLALARIGRVSTKKEVIPVRALFTYIEENFEYTFRQKNISLRVAVDDCTIYADNRHMRQILDNIVDNAVKYMSTSVTRNIGLIGQNMNNGYTRLCVEDTGQGIDLKYHDKIFDPFYRIKTAGEEEEGTGVGLASVKKIVELYDGKIWINSAPGNGTEIWIELPSNKPV